MTDVWKPNPLTDQQKTDAILAAHELDKKVKGEDVIAQIEDGIAALQSLVADKETVKKSDEE